MASFNEVTSTVGQRRVTERVQYSGAGVDSLIAQVAAILKVETGAQRVILDVTKDHIKVEKFVKGTPNPDEQQELFDEVLKSTMMSEYFPEKKVTSYEQICNMFKQVTDEGLEVTLVFVGDMATLNNWLPVSKKEPKICGIKVKKLKNIPDDVIIVCGAEWVGAEPEDIKFTVKGVMS